VWKEVLESKYGSWRNLNGVNSCKNEFWWWRDLCMVSGCHQQGIWFENGMVWRVGEGDNIKF